MTQREKVHQHISDGQPEHIERVREFMAQPSPTAANPTVISGVLELYGKPP